MGYAVLDYDEIEQEELIQTNQSKSNVVQFPNGNEDNLLNSENNSDNINGKKKRNLEADSTYPIKADDLLLMQKRLIQEKRYRDLLILNIGCNVGLRESDLLRIRWNMLFDRNGEFNEGVTVIEKKTRKERVIKFNEDFKKAVMLYLKQEGYASSKYVDMSKDGYLAKSREIRQLKDENKNIIGYTKRLTENSFSRILTKLAKDVGIEYKVSSHSLRKTFGRNYYESSKDIVKLQKIFGHVSQDDTFRYLKLTDKDLEEVYDTVDCGMDRLLSEI